MANVAEYFLLRDAGATAARIPDAGRKEIADALSIGRQKAEAAEALWSNGHAAEGLRLAVESLLITLEAAPRFGRAIGAPPAKAAAVPAPIVKDEPAKTEAEAEKGEAEKADESAEAKAEDGAGEAKAEAAAGEAKAEEPKGEEPKGEEPNGEEPSAAPVPEPGPEPVVLAAGPSWRDVLAQRGVAKERIASIEDAEKKARDTALPKLDAEVSPAHSDLYQAMVRARGDVDRALQYAAMSPRELQWTRIARITTGVVLGALILAALYFVLRTPTAITAEASETFASSPTFQPGNIVDDNPATQWLLSDRQTGWVEARLSPPRHLSRVTLINANNAPHFDRATREYRLEFYSGGRMIRSVDGEFPTYEREPQPVSVEAGLDNVDRVRFVVRSFHNMGGGLAEMQLEE